MTLSIISGAPNRETRNAEAFRSALLRSEPRLNHVDITADILCNLAIPGRQIDLLLLYHDSRAKQFQLRTPDGNPIHSFVLIVEVKNHSPDLIRFEGSTVLVRYDLLWHDATDQCDHQMYALKNYQKANYKGPRRREPTFVQRTIWLARAEATAFDGAPAASSVPVHFSDLNWNDLVRHFVLNHGEVRCLVDRPNDPKYHDPASLRQSLLPKIRPTLLDRRRIDALTRTSFDAETTQYIRDLGTGLLLLRGRAGTGKTIGLIQIALYLSKQGNRTEVITYNHGLIADISRSLRVLAEQESLPGNGPVLKTRYAFFQDIFKGRFGPRAEKVVLKHIDRIEEREAFRVRALTDGPVFLELNIEKCGQGDCPCSDPSVLKWQHLCQTSANPALPDFVLIDEGQDWSEEHRDLVYQLIGPERVVVADGVDQFVSRSRCEWDAEKVPINRRHRMRSSKRTRAATSQTVSEIARELGIEWDIEANKEIPGGRFTVLVEPDAFEAVQRGLEILEHDQRDGSGVRAVDQLVCFPGKSVKGPNFANLFDRATELAERDSWRGFDEADRRIYPVRDGQLRAILYDSCRGMEGWTTLCLGLDAFFDQRLASPEIDEALLADGLMKSLKDKYSRDIYATELEKAKREYAFHWLMIPLTRSIDHLVVHVLDEKSKLAGILRAVSDRYPGQIEWIRFKPADRAN